MMVCAHGDVAVFCKTHDMVICELWYGDILEYSGSCRILVSDKRMSESEYYYSKKKLLSRGVELISTHHKDDPKMIEYLSYEAERRKEKYGGRQPFGFYRKNGVVMERPEMMAVARRILELRDAGATLRKIREDEGVHQMNGGKLSVSTIQQIIKNRNRYESEE